MIGRPYPDRRLRCVAYPAVTVTSASCTVPPAVNDGGEVALFVSSKSVPTA